MIPSSTLRNPVDDRRGMPMSNGQYHAEARTRSLTGVQILATGSYVPDNVVTNHDLRESHGFDPEWIVNRTGIHERRFALPHQATSDLSVHAATRCLEAAGCSPSDVDLLVVGTFTPDMCFPSTANLVQDRMKLNCPAFDVQAACAGFVYALATAAQFVAAGTSQPGAGHRRRLQQPGDQSGRSEELPALRGRGGGRPARPGEPRPGARGLSARLRRRGGRPAEPSRLREPHPSHGRGARAGLALPDHGRPRGLQVGRADPDGFDARRPRQGGTPGRATSAGSSRTRPTCGSSTPPATSWASPATPSSRTWNGTATPPPGRSRSPSTRSSRRGGSIAATCMLTSGFGAGLNWGTVLWRW